MEDVNNILSILIALIGALCILFEFLTQKKRLSVYFSSILIVVVFHLLRSEFKYALITGLLCSVCFFSALIAEEIKSSAKF